MQRVEDPDPALNALRQSHLEWPDAQTEVALLALMARPMAAEVAVELQAYRLLLGLGAEREAALQRLEQAFALREQAQALGADLAEAGCLRVIHALQALLLAHPQALQSAGLAQLLYQNGGRPELAQLMVGARHTVMFQAELFEELLASAQQLLARPEGLPARFRHQLLSGTGAGGAAFTLGMRALDEAELQHWLAQALAWHQQGFELAEQAQLGASSSVSLLNLAVVQAMQGALQAAQTCMDGVAQRPPVDPQRPGWREWQRYVAALIAAQQDPHGPGWQQLLDTARAFDRDGLNRGAVRDTALHSLRLLGQRYGHVDSAHWAVQRLLELQQQSKRRLNAALFASLDAVLERPQLLHQRQVLAQRGLQLEQSLALRNQELSQALAKLQAEMSVRQAAEAALQRAHDELEQRVQQRGQELEQALRALLHQEKQLALARMTVGLAHEMNTPLGNARMAASALPEAAGRLQAELGAGTLRRRSLLELLQQLQEGGQMIDGALGRLTELVERFKGLARSDNSAVRTQIELAPFLSGLVQDWQPRLSAAGVGLTLNCPPDLALQADAEALHQVLQQLLDNSLRHGLLERPQGQIQLQVEARGPDQLCLSWQDNGCGIPAAQMAHAFEPFNAGQLGRSGVGLGLAQVHGLVLGLLGGSIELESPPGQGACVRISLPLGSKRSRLQPA